MEICGLGQAFQEFFFMIIGQFQLNSMQKVFSIVRLLLGYLCYPDRTTYFTIAPSRFGPMTRQCGDNDDTMVRHSDGDGAGVR